MIDALKNLGLSMVFYLNISIALLLTIIEMSKSDYIDNYTGIFACITLFPLCTLAFLRVSKKKLAKDSILFEIKLLYS
jgi:hypothetical protein